MVPSRYGGPEAQGQIADKGDFSQRAAATSPIPMKCLSTLVGNDNAIGETGLRVLGLTGMATVSEENGFDGVGFDDRKGEWH